MNKLPEDNAVVKQLSTRPPIWHSPAWIAAIVGLVSAFLTVPEVVGDYLTKQQDIELAKENTEAVRLGNIESKQEQEFQIVNSTLAQQGTERVFVLRYLASTLDDKDAKAWAEKEVERLDDLASLQEALEKSRREFVQREQELKQLIERNDENSDELKLELDELRTLLEAKNSEVAELRQKAGILSLQDQRTKVLLIRILKNEGYSGDKESVWIDVGSWGLTCGFLGKYCAVIVERDLPDKISIISQGEYADHLLFGGLEVEVFDKLGSSSPFFQKRIVVPYNCIQEQSSFECSQNI